MSKSKLACVLAIVAASVIGVQSTAMAAVSTSNIDSLPSPDGQNITSDSLTGLDWLDPAVTLDESFNMVTARFGTDLAGFSYATREQLTTFLSHLPVPLPTPTSPYPAAFVHDGAASWNSSITYFGTTYTSGNVGWTIGITGDLQLESPGTHYFYYVTGGGDNLISGTVGDSIWPDTDNYFERGSWLIRSTPGSPVVPEPASIAVWSLLGLTIGGAGWWRRKRSARQLLLAVAAAMPLLVSSAQGGVTIESADNYANNYFGFINNQDVNGSAVMHNTVDNGESNPYVTSYASGQNFNDSSGIWSQSYEESYVRSEYNESSGRNSVYFTLTTTSTATLWLNVSAYSNGVVNGDENIYARAIAELYDFTTATSYSLLASSTNGGPSGLSQFYSSTIPLTLSAGQYYLSSYAYGYDYSTGSYMHQFSDASAILRDIQPVQEGSVPEPASLAVWSLLGLTIGGATWRRHKRSA
jgi:uncharacterized protein YxeA